MSRNSIGSSGVCRTMSNLNTEAHFRSRGYLDNRNIDRDLPCRKCGYNLRGLVYGTKCPECGTVIERKRLLYDHIMDADASYLKSLRFGLALSCIGLWSPAFAGSLEHYSSALGKPGPVLAVFAAGSLIFIGGIWLITQRKPHEGPPEEWWMNLSMWARAATMVLPVLAFVTYFLVGSPFEAFSCAVRNIAMFAELAFLALIFEDLSKWARDDESGDTFGMLVGTFVIFAIAELILAVSGASVFTFGCIGRILVYGSIFWFMVLVVRLFGTVQRAIIDKPVHDASVFRNPGKKLY